MFLETKKEGEARTTIEPWRQLLLNAADYMEQHGKCEEVGCDEQGRVCTIGALTLANGGGSGPWEQVLPHLTQFIGTYFLIEWSDSNSQDHVIRALRECASR